MKRKDKRSNQEKWFQPAGAGVATWKLALIAVGVILLSVVGGIVVESGWRPRNTVQVDLGFDLSAGADQTETAG